MAGDTFGEAICDVERLGWERACMASSQKWTLICILLRHTCTSVQEATMPILHRAITSMYRPPTDISNTDTGLPARP